MSLLWRAARRALESDPRFLVACEGLAPHPGFLVPRVAVGSQACVARVAVPGAARPPPALRLPRGGSGARRLTVGRSAVSRAPRRGVHCKAGEGRRAPPVSRAPRARRGCGAGGSAPPREGRRRPAREVRWRGACWGHLSNAGRRNGRERFGSRMLRRLPGFGADAVRTVQEEVSDTAGKERQWEGDR